MTSAELTSDVALAAELIRQGRLVAFATETVYGLGANALDPQAAARIFEAKQRPYFDPLIVHLAAAEELDRFVKEIPTTARQLIEHFWPGPLTLVLPKREMVPDLVTSGLPTVAVRVPDHPQARELIRLSGVPIAAPSANLFGRVSPTTSAHVLEQLGERIDAVLEGGPCRVGVESTVLDFSEGLRPDASRGQCRAPRLLRPGGVTIEEIEAVIGPVMRGGALLERHAPQVSPGMLAKHYSPGKPVLLVDDWDTGPRGPEIGVLSFQETVIAERYGHVEVLSVAGSLTEAAAGFFAALRRLDDDAGIRRIVARRFPDIGLGTALNDRLQRAAATDETDQLSGRLGDDEHD